MTEPTIRDLAVQLRSVIVGNRPASVEHYATDAYIDTIERHARRLIDALLSQPTSSAEQFDFTYIANRVQFQTGRSIWPRTVEAVLKVALSQSTPSAEPDPYEYETTTGQRKAWPNPDEPPEGDGWELDPNRGRPGESWERFDFHEERYWRRLRQRTEPTNTEE